MDQLSRNVNSMWTDRVCTSVGVGGRGFLDPRRWDGLDLKPVNDIIYGTSEAFLATGLSLLSDCWVFTPKGIWFSPFLLSSTLQPMACLTSCWQHSHAPSIQEQGWYFCMRSLLKRTTMQEYGVHTHRAFTLDQHFNLPMHTELSCCAATEWCEDKIECCFTAQDTETSHRNTE